MQPVEEPTNDTLTDPEDKLAAAETSQPKLNIVPAPEKPETEIPEPAAPDHPIMGDKAIPQLRPFTGSEFSNTASPAQPAAKPSLSIEGVSKPVPPQATPLAQTAPGRPQGESAASVPVSSSSSSSTTPNTPFSSVPQEGAQNQNTFQPVVGSAGGYSGGGSAGSPAPYSPVPAGHSRMTKILRIVIPIFVVLLLTGSYVFGMYLPNKPENVFKTGLTRTGIAADKLTAAGTEKSKLDAVKKIELSGSVKVVSPSGSQSGTFSSRYDDSKTDSSLTYKPADSKQNFSVQALTDLASGQTYPDIYFKVTGLSVLGIDQQAPELMQFDSKWIAISPAFLQSVIPPEYAAGQTKSGSELTPQDVAELTKAVVTTTREYVLTNDPAKNVLINKSFKGKETIEGNIAANRYAVGLDKAHVKDFCKALITNVMATQGFKRIPGVPTDNLDETRSAAIKTCQDGADGIKDSDTFDMWVNTKNKLIAKVRLADESNKDIYLDIGHAYTKGSVLPAYVIYHSKPDKYDAKVWVTTDFAKNSTKVDFNGTFGEGADKWTVTANAAFKPYEGDLKITKPNGSISIEKVLQTLGIDPAALTGAAAPSPAVSAYGGVQAKAKDTERQTDVKALQSQLEGYNATTGMYPKLAEINDASWRRQNMKGLDSEALRDPDGQEAKLAATPSATQYGYAPAQCDVFNGCQSYTLTAIFSSGKAFTVENLN